VITWVGWDRDLTNAKREKSQFGCGATSLYCSLISCFQVVRRRLIQLKILARVQQPGVSTFHFYLFLKNLISTWILSASTGQKKLRIIYGLLKTFEWKIPPGIEPTTILMSRTPSSKRVAVTRACQRDPRSRI
jgi:hypothetical protein